MSDSAIPLAAGALAVAIVGFSEGIAWIITPVVVVGVLAVGALLLASSGRAIAPVGRYSSDSTNSKIRRHEAGHYRVAKRLGGRPEYIDDTTVRPNLPASATPTEWVAFLAAGEVATRSSQGCSGDRAEIRKILRGLPAGERSRVKRDGYALARRLA